MFPLHHNTWPKATNMLLIIVLSSIFFTSVSSELKIVEDELTVLVGGETQFSLILTEPEVEELNVTLHMPESGVVSLTPKSLLLPAQSTGPWPINITGVDGGHVLVYATVSPNITSDAKAFLRITSEYSEALTTISFVIGWIYFVAWSISFYPQIYENYVRKSVIGLNFDFLALNIVGFTMYSLFNCGLYWIPEIEEEYFRRHPRGLNPVQLNDIVFALHATFATILTILQCFCYERGNQRVSTTARSILGAFLLILIVCLGLSLFNYIQWIDFLYDCSYIKLTITLIKYIPQALMNYQRKSTVGWSIGNVLLDFTGGILSIGQMLLNAYNYDDWKSIFGDPTKFGLGAFSVIFDILFIFQHYILYRDTRYELITGEVHVQVPAPEDEQLVPEQPFDAPETLPSADSTVNT